MNGDVIVRPYEPRDRAAVREICCDTADAGEPVERYFPDREVFADLLTRYYTDIAPEFSWVAEQDGRVVGYLLGCVDSRKFVRAMVWRIVPRALVRALGRGLFWNRRVWRLLKANCHSKQSTFNRSQVYQDYPAHLHINLRRDFRAHGTGQALMDRFLEQMTGVGVHAGVSDGNERGKIFFEKQGFIALGSEDRMRTPEQAAVPALTVIYGKRADHGKLS